jgi:hypothetical protein
MREKSVLTNDLSKQEKSLDRKKSNVAIKKLKREIRLEQMKQCNALIREQSFKKVYKAARSIELKK